MGGACGTYGGGEMCKQGFGGETWEKETTWYTWAWEDIIEMDLQEVERVHGLNWSGSG